MEKKRRKSDISQLTDYEKIYYNYTKHLLYLQKLINKLPKNPDIPKLTQQKIDRLLVIFKFIEKQISKTVDEIKESSKYFNLFYQSVLQESIDLIHDISQEKLYYHFFKEFTSSVADIKFSQFSYNYFLDGSLPGETLIIAKDSLCKNTNQYNVKRSDTLFELIQQKTKKVIVSLPYSTVSNQNQELPFILQLYIDTRPELNYIEYEAKNLKGEIITVRFYRLNSDNSSIKGVLIHYYLQKLGVRVRKMEEQILCYQLSSKEIYIICQYEKTICTLDDLINERSKQKGPWTEDQLLLIFEQIYTIIVQFHKNKISFRNLKPKNIICSSLNNTQVIQNWKFDNLHASCIIEEPIQNQLQNGKITQQQQQFYDMVGSINYMSAQLLAIFELNQVEGAYNPKAADFYSMAICFLRMKTLKEEIPRDNLNQLLNSIKSDEELQEARDFTSTTLICSFLNFSESYRTHFEQQNVMNFIKQNPNKLQQNKCITDQYFVNNIICCKHSYINPTFQKSLETQMYLGRNLMKLKLKQRSLNAFLEAIQLAQKAEQKSQACQELGYAYQIFGDPASALSYYKKAVNLLENQFGLYCVEVTPALNNVGVILKNGGQLDLSIQTLRRAKVILEKAYGPDYIDIARTNENLANSLLENKQIDEAYHLYMKVLDVKQKYYGQDNIEIAITENNLALTLLLQNQIEEALIHFQKVQNIHEQVYGLNNLQNTDIYIRIAEILIQLQKNDDGFLYYLRAIELLEAHYGLQDHRNIKLIQKIYELAEKQKNNQKAIEFQQKYREIVKQEADKLKKLKQKQMNEKKIIIEKKY